MAIKIINDTPHPSVVKEVICKNCGVTLSYTPNDLLHRSSKDYDGGSTYTYVYIVCPKCKKDINIKDR